MSPSWNSEEGILWEGKSIGKSGFTPRVASCTRTGEAILADEVKVAAYKDAFGKKKDLAPRAAIHGAGKAANRGEGQAAAAHSGRWEASNRALALAGKNAPGIQSLQN